MIILDGKKLAEDRQEALRERVATLDFVPKLAIVRVGERADSLSYINRKIDYGKSIGIDTDISHFDENISELELIKKVEELNEDDSVNGIIVQLPLPQHINASNVLNTISSQKDVDGLSAINIRKLVNNDEGGITPATPKGILNLLKSFDIDIKGKKVVVVGRSLLVGKSTAMLMLNNNATVTVCHSQTENLSSITKTADILVVAVGNPNFIKKEHLKEGSVVIDVGISPLGDKEIAGDVDFEDVKEVVYAISPVPGGVGPMTVLSLFENLLDSIKK